MKFQKRSKNEMTHESVTRRNLETHKRMLDVAIQNHDIEKIVEYSFYVAQYENIMRDFGYELKG